jgi:alpha-galactosidase
MSPAQRGLVAEAVQVYKAIRGDLAESVPFWPLGLPGWDDSWVVQGLRTAERSYLLVWRRGGAQFPAVTGAADPGQVTLPVAHLLGRPAQAEVLFGTGQGEWSPAAGALTVTLPPVPAACLIRLAPA